MKIRIRNLKVIAKKIHTSLLLQSELDEVEIVLLIKFPTTAAWDSSNDYSAQGLGTMPDYDSTVFTGLTPNIPVYENGELLWGQEP